MTYSVIFGSTRREFQTQAQADQFARAMELRGVECTRMTSYPVRTMPAGYRF